MNKFIETVVNANDFKDLDAYKAHLYKQFEENKHTILKVDKEELSIGLDNFKPEFEIRFDYLDKNDSKKRWLYVAKVHECSVDGKIMVDNKPCFYNYQIAPDLKVFQTKGHGSISNIADKEQKTYKGYNFLIDHEKKTTTITLKSVNINEFTKAKENGTEMIPYRETYEYQGTNLYDIANDAVARLSKIE